MSKEFMQVCTHERTRLLNKVSSTEHVLNLYRQLWKLYGELEATSDHKATWAAARTFIAETVSPSVKAELKLYQESLENVTRAQAQGCMSIESLGGKNG